MSYPYVTFSPGVRFGRPTLNHTNLSVETVADMVVVEPVDVVADEFGITRPDVIVCCWYMATYGTRRWRTNWGGWADSVGVELWHGRYDVPDPPEWPTRRRGGGSGG